VKSSPNAAAPEVAPGQYVSREYNTKERLCSFWHQVDETFELGAQDVLEVGLGSGLVADWLRKAGLEVKTLDLDPELKPDIAGSVLEIPLADDAIDSVLCCQVLEHLPFEQFEVALAEIGRVSRLGAVISLPDVTPWVGLSYPLYFGLYANQVRGEIPFGWVAVLRALRRRQIRLGEYLFARYVPSRWAYGGPVWEMKRPPIPHGDLTPQDFEGGEAHCWEIGMVGYPLERVEAAFTSAGLTITKQFRVPENPWHHFFVVAHGDPNAAHLG
jgi:SAM-dependent methyltransferase